MDQATASKQIAQMKDFIISEATEKAFEIAKKGEEEFGIEFHRIITDEKEKVRAKFDKQLKQIDTQYAISRSMAINKQRLEKIKERQSVMSRVARDAQDQLVEAMKDGAQQKTFYTKLIVQALLMLLEEHVVVRCRRTDKLLVESCLVAAAEEYQKVIKANTGASKTVKLVVDTDAFLDPPPSNDEGAPSCLGGVVILCQSGKILVDNTIDMRLRLVMEQDKPAIRKLLFPGQ